MALALQELVIRLSALERRVVEFEQENAELKKEVHFLKLENKALREENDRLRERVGLNSSNSSLPPCKNILKAEKMMWLFLEDPLRIPPTNNLAERQIRKYVVYRKTSYFAWAERGERYLERMLSLFLTYQKENPFQKLLQILEPGLIPIPLT